MIALLGLQTTEAVRINQTGADKPSEKAKATSVA